MDTPIKQSVSELNFHVFERPLHPELFHLHATRQFFQGDYEVHLWVTGCSHLVSVFADEHCMTEVICPPDQPLPRHGLLERFPFRGEKSYKRNWAGSFKYMAGFQVEAMSVNLYHATHNDLVTSSKKRGLFVSYPQWARNGLAPFSYIDYEARMEELQIHAFHAFPEHQTIIKTQSLFNLKR